MNDALSAVVSAVLPLLPDLIAGVAALIVGQFALVAKRRFGLEIEARHREALHSAIASGLQAAISRGLPRGAAINAAVTYARSSVPDAIAALAPEPGVLADLARAKSGLLSASITPDPKK